MIKVAIGHHDTAFMQILKTFLSRYNNIQIVHEASCGNEFLAQLRINSLPDVAILAADLPDETGLQIAGNFRALEFKTKIVILSAFPGRPEAEAALDAGAKAYVDRSAGMETVLNAVFSASKDKTYIYLSKGFWMQKTIGNAFGIKLLRLLPKHKEKDLYEKLLKRGFSKHDIHTVLNKLIRHGTQKKE